MVAVRDHDSPSLSVSHPRVNGCQCPALLLLTASEPPATPSPSLLPFGQGDTAELVQNALDRFADVNWWVTVFAPVAIKVVVIVVAAVVFRFLLVRGRETCRPTCRQATYGGEGDRFVRGASSDQG